MKRIGMAVVLLAGLMLTGYAQAQECYATPVCKEMEIRSSKAVTLLNGLIEEETGISAMDRIIVSALKTRAMMLCMLSCLTSETDPVCRENGSQRTFWNNTNSLKESYLETINRAGAVATTAAERIYILELDTKMPVDSRFAKETLGDYGIRAEDVFPCETQF